MASAAIIVLQSNLCVYWKQKRERESKSKQKTFFCGIKDRKCYGNYRFSPVASSEMSNFFVFVSHHEIIFFSSFCTYKLWWRKSIYFHFNAHPFLPSSSSSSNRSRSHFNLHHSTRSAHTHVLREQLFHISHDELKSVIHLWRWWWFNLPTHESVVNLIFEKSFICHVQWSLRGGGEKSSFVIKKAHLYQDIWL